jgi:hypothetical protein
MNADDSPFKLPTLFFTWGRTSLKNGGALWIFRGAAAVGGNRSPEVG